MATQVGEAVIKLTFDGKQFKAEVNQAEKDVAQKTGSMSKAFSTVGSGVAKTGKIIGTAFAAGTAVATAAVVKLGKDALQSFADYEQLTGGVETLFKDSADAIFQYADEAYKTAGVSANEYMEQATSFSASLIQGLGGDTKKAAEYANKAIVDMSDNANKMGTDISLIQSAYQGFAKQNYTMLDNLKLGYGGTASEMARLINDSGVLGKKVKITAKEVNSVSFDKIIEAIHRTQERMDITGTTAKEAATTISGSVNTMKKAWQNLITGVADDTQDMPKLIQNFVDSLSDVFANIGPTIKVIAKGIGDLVKQLAPVLTEMIPTFVNDLLPPLIEAIVQLTLALIPMIPTILQILVDALVKNLPLIVQGLLQIIPQLIGMIPYFIGAALQIFAAVAGELFNTIAQWLGSFGEFFGNVFQNVVNFVLGVWDFFFKLWWNNISALGEFFASVWEGFSNGAKAAFEFITGIFSNLANFFGSIFSKAWQAVKAVFSTGGKIFAGIVDGIVKAFKGIVNAIITGINKVVAIPFNTINGVLDGLRGIDILGIRPFGWVGRIGVPQIPKLAQGGYASGATGAIIGEAGKEVVLPLERNTDNWAGLLASTLAKQMNEEGTGGRPIVVNMTNQINNEMDAEDIGRVLMQSIRRAS